MEKRRSIRAYGSRPPDSRQIGEFFYRTARVLEIMDTGQGRRD
jgi:hypothetical protein